MRPFLALVLAFGLLSGGEAAGAPTGEAAQPQAPLAAEKTAGGATPIEVPVQRAGAGQPASRPHSEISAQTAAASHASPPTMATEQDAVGEQAKVQADQQDNRSLTLSTDILQLKLMIEVLIALMAVTVLLLIAILVLNMRPALPAALVKEFRSYEPARLRELIDTLERLLKEMEATAAAPPAPSIFQPAAPAPREPRPRPDPTPPPAPAPSGLAPRPDDYYSQRPRRSETTLPQAPVPVPPASQAFPSESISSGRARPATDRLDAPQPVSPSSDAFVRRLLQEFNSLASNYSPRDNEQFEQTYSDLSAAAIDDDGNLAETEEGSLWLARLPGPSGAALLLPGREMVKNWDKFYRNNGGRAARRRFGAYYDVEAGPLLRVTSPTIVEQTSTGWRLVRAGALVGI